MGAESRLYKSIARLVYFSTFVHFFRNEVCMKVGDCLYLYFEVLVSKDVSIVMSIKINLLLQDLGFFTLVWLRTEVPVT